jgi:hypothetical protein
MTLGRDSAQHRKKKPVYLVQASKHIADELS